MYSKESMEHQYSFSHNKFFLKPKLDENEILFKIAESIDWCSLSDKFAKFYCTNNGRPTKPSRLKIGLHIIKHLKTLSDEETIAFLKQNIYAQYLCDVSIEEAKNPIDPSALSRFRTTIGTEGVKLIEKEILRILKKNKLIKGKKLIIDTTVVPSCIKYPTDINLLETVRNKAVQLLDQAKQFGAKAYRTYKRTARKVYLSYQKVRKHTVRQRKKTQKKLIQFTSRNIRQLKSCAKSLAKKAKETKQETIETFSEKVNGFLSIADNIIYQQRNIYNGDPVKKRIVSTWATHIRPMVRGKYPVDVEFGPKVLLNLKNGFLFLAGLYFENVSDTALLIPAIEENKKLLGYLPTQVSTDRGFYSAENKSYCQELGIKKIAIEKRGKHKTDSDPPPYLARLRRERCAIEAKISLAKRKFGLNRINYRIKGGEEIWTRLSLAAMNLNLGFSPG
jgi:IS5 family transposase